jgi:hypothetical protein
MPIKTIKPGPIAPDTDPFTITVALATRCTTTRIAIAIYFQQV